MTTLKILQISKRKDFHNSYNINGSNDTINTKAIIVLTSMAHFVGNLCGGYIAKLLLKFKNIILKCNRFVIF